MLTTEKTNLKFIVDDKKYIIIKPNKSSPYYRLYFEDPIYANIQYEDKIFHKFEETPSTMVTIGLTRKQLIRLYEYLKNNMGIVKKKRKDELS